MEVINPNPGKRDFSTNEVLKLLVIYSVLIGLL